MVQTIANFMKMAYVTWNKDSVADETIISDLKGLSKGELTLQENINLNKVEFRTPPPGNRQKSLSPSNNNKGRQNNSRNNAGNGTNNRQRNNNTGGKRY